MNTSDRSKSRTTEQVLYYCIFGSLVTLLVVIAFLQLVSAAVSVLLGVIVGALAAVCRPGD